MKKLLLLVILLAGSLFASVDERITDIYFGNGIMTTEDEAEATLREIIQPTILDEIYNGDEAKMNTLHNFDIAYNYSAKEDFGDTPIAMALDLLESYEQMTNTSFGWWTATLLVDMAISRLNFVHYWTKQKWLDYLVSKGMARDIANILADKLADMTLNQFADLVRAVTYDVDEIHDSDLEEMRGKYVASIKDGHGVILLTHSQGNLFAQEATNREWAHQGVNDFKTWMQEYVYQISVASPAPGFASDHHWLISLDNDAVPNTPGSVGTSHPNPIRHFGHKATSISPMAHMSSQTIEMWTNSPPEDPSSPAGYWLRGTSPQSYTKTIRASIDGIMQDYTFDVAPDESLYSAIEFHSFDYYMGRTFFDTHISAQNTIRMNSAQTRTDIIAGIKNAILQHKSADSQWKKSKETGTCATNGCGRRLELVHKEYDYITFPMDKIEDVYPFNETGKLYPINGTYVKASAGGTEITTLEDHATLCYRLEGTGEEISRAQLSEGTIELTLNWENEAIDLDLSMQKEGNPVGHRDVASDETCAMEHLYLGESLASPGIYQGYINLKSEEVNASMLPQTLYFVIKAGSAKELVKFAVNDKSALDLGHVVDIEIKELSSGGTSNEGASIHGPGAVCKSSPYVTIEERNITTVSSPLEGTAYAIAVYVNQVIAGPLSGAHLNLYELQGFVEGDDALFRATATEGEKLYTAGLVELSDEFKAGLRHDGLYLLTASGGLDIDADDNGAIDAEPTANAGTMHGVLTGEVMQESSFKVNILTELAYQVTAELFPHWDEGALVTRYDDIAVRLMDQGCNDADVALVDHNDLYCWIPYAHKGLLQKNYADHFAPVVEKLLDGMPIRDDAYLLIYDSLPPVADAGQDMTQYVGEDVVLDASQSYHREPGRSITSYEWFENGISLGKSSTSQRVLENLALGRHDITLQVEDDNGIVVIDSITVTVLNRPPVAVAGDDVSIQEGEMALLDGSGSSDPDGTIVSYLWTRENETICTTAVCSVNGLEFGSYMFELQVTDNHGASSVDYINVYVEGVGKVVRSISVPGSLANAAIASDDRFLYVAERSEGLQIIDVNDSAIGSLNGFGTAEDIVQSPDERVAYIATTENGVQLVNIENPSDPFLLGEVPFSEATTSIVLSPEGTKAYVGTASGLTVLDLDNPTEPVVIFHRNLGSTVYDVVVSPDGNFVYVSTLTRISVIDVSEPASSLVMEQIEISGKAWQLALSREEPKLYVAAQWGGLQVYDISFTENEEAEALTPELSMVSQTPVSYEAWSIALSPGGGTVYVGDKDGSVAVMDVTNPENVTLVGNVFTSGSVLALRISNDGKALYALCGDVIDLIALGTAP